MSLPSSSPFSSLTAIPPPGPDTLSGQGGGLTFFSSKQPFSPVLILGELQLPCIELIVGAFLLDQVFVISTLDDASVLQNHDRVTVTYCRQTVGDDKNGTSFHQVIHTFLHDTFCTSINTGRRLIQNQYRRIGHSGSCNGKKLSLSLGKLLSVSA